jgi:hypothetical protein
MKVLKRFLLGFGTVLLLALSLQVVAPQAVHAVVATFVEVANTVANPVPTVDAKAQTAFVVESTCTFGVNLDNSLSACEIIPLYSVPAGRIAVLESYSASCGIDSGTALADTKYSFTSPAGSPVSISVPPTAPAAGAQTTDAALNLTSYASGGASGTPINFNAAASTRESSSSVCKVTISGYLQ